MGYGYWDPDQWEPATKNLTKDEFIKIWPESTWPDRAQSFRSAKQTGDVFEVEFYGRLGIIFHTFTLNEKKPHRCEFVNVSFNFVVMACKECGKPQ